MRVRGKYAGFEMDYRAMLNIKYKWAAERHVQRFTLVKRTAKCPSSTAHLRDAHLEQVGLLHDAEELLLVDLAVPVTVGFVDHLLELLIGHPLAKLLGDALEILERDLASLVIVEQPESLEDLVLRIAIEDLLRHHRHELREFDGARPIIVDVLDLLLLLLGQLLLLPAATTETPTQRHRRNFET